MRCRYRRETANLEGSGLEVGDEETTIESALSMFRESEIYAESPARTTGGLTMECPMRFTSLPG